jgi:hypothetical protein
MWIFPTERVLVGHVLNVSYKDTFGCETSSALNDERGRKAGHGFPLSDTLCDTYRVSTRINYEIVLYKSFLFTIPIPLIIIEM